MRAKLFKWLAKKLAPHLPPTYEITNNTFEPYIKLPAR